MSGNRADRVQFGPFEADLHTHELWKYGTRIRLGALLAGRFAGREDRGFRLARLGTSPDYAARKFQVIPFKARLTAPKRRSLN